VVEEPGHRWQLVRLAGPEVAQAIQLGIEYDPSPPFDSGHPDKASEAAVALMVHRNAEAHEGVRQGLERWASSRRA
jgi:cyclohexyl-isocyanide hydratase